MTDCRVVRRTETHHIATAAFDVKGRVRVVGIRKPLARSLCLFLFCIVNTFIFDVRGFGAATSTSCVTAKAIHQFHIGLHPGEALEISGSEFETARVFADNLVVSDSPESTFYVFRGYEWFVDVVHSTPRTIPGIDIVGFESITHVRFSGETADTTLARLTKAASVSCQRVTRGRGIRFTVRRADGSVVTEKLLVLRRVRPHLKSTLVLACFDGARPIVLSGVSVPSCRTPEAA